ncbi:hypothetical protein HDU91_001024 [Kappamyces sp. JEL0680]|nr:hypothetical protein HDU91_001024 [Kappamyces sp. JEL0680]
MDLTVWLKLESNRHPFKVSFTGKDIYDLKKEAKLELTPKLNAYSVAELAICPRVKAAAMKDNQVVAELHAQHPSSFEQPWLLQTPSKSLWTDHVSNLSVEIPSWRLPDVEVALSVMRRIKLITVLYVMEQLYYFKPFSVVSATGLLLLLHVICALHLKLCPEQFEHYTNSALNFRRKRYWTLLTSSFAHGDINHLACNMVSLAIVGPVVEKMLGSTTTVLFFIVSSVVSGLVSIQYSGYKSIGSSGSIYAFDGFLISYYVRHLNNKDFLKEYVFDEILFYLATQDCRLDYFAHFGGFAFGYLSEILFFFR